MKGRLVLIVAALAALVAAGALAAPTLLSLNDVSFAPEASIAEGTAIEVRTQVDGFGVHKGDAFPYRVEVRYNRELVTELDKTSLDESMNLKPFEIRGMVEEEFDQDARTHVWTRTYEIQLIDGLVNTLYTFPTIVVRYRSAETLAYEEKSITPEPVYVASRLPADAGELALKPIQPLIEAPGQGNLPGVLLALGAFLVLVALGDLAWRGIPQWRRAARARRTAEGVDVLCDAYRSLQAGAAQGAEPRQLLLQMEHIVRVVLVRKEGIGWLDTLDPERVSPGIRPEMTALCAALHSNDADAGDEGRMRAALAHLNKALCFYFGEREIQAWQR